MSETKQNMQKRKGMRTIDVYDFDGTITKSDTLILFIKYCYGTWHLVEALILFSPMLILMKLHIINNGKMKERLFGYFFHGMSLDEFNRKCDSFARQNKRAIMRESIMSKIECAIEDHIPVFIVSASIDNWVIPFFYDNNRIYSLDNDKPIKIIGTQVEVRDGILTGHFSTPNCYGAEKVRRLKEALPDLDNDRSSYYIFAFGDSRGDKEMLEYADNGTYVK